MPAVMSFLVSMLVAGAEEFPAIDHVDTFGDGGVLDVPGRAGDPRLPAPQGIR